MGSAITRIHGTSSAQRWLPMPDCTRILERLPLRGDLKPFSARSVRPWPVNRLALGGAKRNWRFNMILRGPQSLDSGVCWPRLSNRGTDPAAHSHCLILASALQHPPAAHAASGTNGAMTPWPPYPAARRKH